MNVVPLISKCFESHTALEVGAYKIYGGSCHTPAVKADLYLALDHTSLGDSQPWDVGPLRVSYRIQDQQAPKNTEKFKEMLRWICNQLQKGKKLHVGCIGGHGRTGLVLSALVATLTKNENPILYVRKNYCSKAVESEEQVDFLVKHFGVPPAPAVKNKYTNDVFEFSKGYDQKKSKEYEKSFYDYEQYLSKKNKSGQLGHFSGAIMPPLKKTNN